MLLLLLRRRPRRRAERRVGGRRGGRRGGGAPGAAGRGRAGGCRCCLAHGRCLQCEERLARACGGLGAAAGGPRLAPGGRRTNALTGRRDSLRDSGARINASHRRIEGMACAARVQDATVPGGKLSFDSRRAGPSLRAAAISADGGRDEAHLSRGLRSQWRRRRRRRRARLAAARALRSPELPEPHTLPRLNGVYNRRAAAAAAGSADCCGPQWRQPRRAAHAFALTGCKLRGWCVGRVVVWLFRRAAAPSEGGVGAAVRNARRRRGARGSRGKCLHAAAARAACAAPKRRPEGGRHAAPRYGRSCYLGAAVRAGGIRSHQGGIAVHAAESMHIWGVGQIPGPVRM
jgi:hypothetical protein